MTDQELRKEIERLKRANDELSFLDDISQSIVLVQDVEEVMQTILRKSVRAVSAVQGTVVLVDEESGKDPDTLVRSIVTLEGGMSYTVDIMIIGWMVLNRVPISLVDPKTDARFSNVPWDKSIRSILCVPLLISSRLIGVLTVFNKQNAPGFSEADMRLLMIIAAQSAQLIENARLYGVEESHEQLKLAQTELLHSKKMAALSALVAGLLHEINSPLGAMKSAKDVALRCLAGISNTVQSGDVGDETKKQLQPYLDALEQGSRVIDDAGDRITNIVSGLKSFARLDEAHVEDMDINEGLDCTLALIQPGLSERIKIVKEYGDIPFVPCHAAEINQVFMHLLTNAAQAIEGDGSITLRTYAKQDMVTIGIADTGTGIPDGQMQSVFDPVFSKKEGRVKAGLGLFTCSNIVEKHGGEIRARSEMGKGSTFEIRLPTQLLSE